MPNPFAAFFRAQTEAITEELDRTSPADRLRMMADIGAWTRRALGPVGEDYEAFADRALELPEIRNSPTVRFEQDRRAVRENLLTFYTTGRWADYGYNVFDLSADLAAGFVLTDPPPTPAGGLALPFPCFCLRLPVGTVPMFLHGKQVWAEALWVHEFTAIHEIEGRTRFLRYSVISGGSQFWRDRFPGDLDKDPVDESMFNQVMYGDPPLVPEDTITSSTMLRVLKNFISWLHATGAMSTTDRPQPPHLRRKASREKRAQVESGIWPHVWFMGKEVKLQPELRRMAREIALGASSEHAPSGWKVRARHIVRGHFRHFHVGEGRTETVLKWVAPFWRGPQGEIAWAHLYSAGETKNES